MVRTLMKSWIKIFLVVVWLSALPGLAAAASCVTANCHALLGKAAVVHAPVAEGDCAACHAATGKPHPGAGSMALAAKGRELCLSCHNDPAKGLPFVHPPVADGCTDCHAPHQGGNAKLLLQPGGALCLMCHDDVMSGRKVHGPVAAGNCAICHTPHASANQGLLTLPGNEPCLACHAQIGRVIEQAKSQHEPVANGRCWECHTPHASDSVPQLRAFYPQEFYVPYREEHFALCFSCHDKNAFEYERTTEATRFRNRDQNLHYFHVTRLDKGRVCKNCHGIHGADQPKLVQSKSPDFGKWQIPVYFKMTETGGACAAGCHRPKAYDREKVFRNL